MASSLPDRKVIGLIALALVLCAGAALILFLPQHAAAQPVGGTISGNVTAIDGGGPLIGVTVSATDQGGTTSFHADTDISGDYTITNIPTGTWVVDFTPHDGIHSKKFYNRKNSPQAADTLYVVDGQAVIGVDQVLPLLGSISGTITDKVSGAALINCNVYAYDYSWPVNPPEVSTDNAGNYTISGLNEGPYTIMFDPNDGSHVIKYYHDKTFSDEADLVTVVGGTTQTGIDDALTTGGSLSGSVVDSLSGAPFANVKVTLSMVRLKAHQRYSSLAAFTYTDNSGHYLFTHQVGAAYSVNADLSTDPNALFYKPVTFYNGKPDADTADLVGIQELATTAGIVIRPVPGGRVSGTVSDRLGTRINHCAVSFFEYVAVSHTWAQVCTTATGEDGTYTSDYLVPGTFKVVFVPDPDKDKGHASQWYINKPDLQHGDTITVSPTHLTDNVNATLTIKAQISGRIVCKVGTLVGPIEGAHVNAYQQQGSQWNQVTTELTLGCWGNPSNPQWGRYTLYLAPGTYKVQVLPSRPLWLPQWLQGKDSLASATPITIAAEQQRSVGDTVLATAPKVARYAVDAADRNNYSQLLSQCGISCDFLATTAPHSDYDSYDLTNECLLDQYDAVFINCSAEMMVAYNTIRGQGGYAYYNSALSHYVRGGGRLFISDDPMVTFNADFQLNPGDPNPTYPFMFIYPYQQVPIQNVTANITDSRMRSYLGRSTCPLTFDQDGHAAVGALDPSVSLSMAVPSLATYAAGPIINAPVCMTLPLGAGKIQYQTFHLDKQPLSLAKPLLEYLLTDGAGMPHINSISPTKGSVGTTVTITGTNFGTSKVSDSYVTFNSQTVGTYKSWSASQIQVLVPNGASNGPVRVYTKGGTSNGVTFTLTTGPATPTVWYLAEGTSDWGFDTFVTIENPNNATVTAAITYMTPKGATSRPDVSLPPMSQTTINPRNDLGATDFSTKVVCRESKPITVDRRMTWTGPGAPSPEGTSSIGVSYASGTWFLPEGSAAWGFECWLLAQNPNSQPARIKVTYMMEGGATQVFYKDVPANSRGTWSMGSDIGAKDASVEMVSNVPIIAERSMYRNNRREGHESIGTPGPASTYYLAEGTTGYGFTTYVLVQNPNPKPSSVTLTYMTTKGPQTQPVISLPANSRKTIRVNDVPGMQNQDFSTQVFGSLPIIAERAMYWGSGSSLGEACHDSIGMDSPHKTFYLPDGEAQNGYETWTCVQNPNASAVNVLIQYLPPGGGANNVKSVTDTIPANSRKTYFMADVVKNGKAAIEVTCTTTGKKIMVERAMYWNNRGAGTDTIGGYSD